MHGDSYWPTGIETLQTLIKKTFHIRSGSILFCTSSQSVCWPVWSNHSLSLVILFLFSAVTRSTPRHQCLFNISRESWEPVNGCLRKEETPQTITFDFITNFNDLELPPRWYFMQIAVTQRLYFLIFLVKSLVFQGALKDLNHILLYPIRV